MKYCKNCNSQYEDKFEFCRKCGKKLEVLSDEVTQSNNKFGNKVTLLLIGVLAVVAVGLFFVIGGNFGKEKPVIKAVAEDGSMELAVAKENGKWGIIDKTGKWFIKPEYASVGEFSEGLLAVQDVKTKLWGFIDKKESWVIPPKFSHQKQDDRMSYSIMPWMSDYDRKAIRYIHYGFSEGLAPVVTETQMGYIDKQGSWEIILPFKPQKVGGLLGYVHNFKNGVATYGHYRIGKNGFYERKEGLVHKSGEILLPPTFDRIDNAHEGYRIVREDSKEAFIGEFGQDVGSGIYDEAYDFSEGLSVVKYNDNHNIALINKSFKTVKDLSYIGNPETMRFYGYKDGIGELSYEYGDKKKKYVYIDRLGNLIENKNEKHKKTTEERVKIGFKKINNIQYCIVRDNKTLDKPIIDYIVSGFDKDRVAIVEVDGKTGVVDEYGEFLIPNKFEIMDKFKRYSKADIGE